MTYTFQDSGNGSLIILVDGVFRDAIAGAEVRYKKNIAQNYVELSDGEHVFYSINISDVSGASDLDDILDAIEAALPDLTSSESSSPGGDFLTTDGNTTGATAAPQEFTSGVTSTDTSGGGEKVGLLSGSIISVSDNIAGTYSQMDKDGLIVGVNIAHPSQLATPADAIKINGVKVYRALLTQSGTDAPVATVLENTLGEVPTWGRANPGDYTLTTVGSVFAANKTFCPQNGHCFFNGNSGVYWGLQAQRTSGATFTFQTIDKDTISPADDLIAATPSQYIEFEILIYP